MGTEFESPQPSSGADRPSRDAEDRGSHVTGSGSRNTIGDSDKAILEEALERLPFDFFAIGTDGRYVLQNSTCQSNWGDVIGRTPSDVAPNDTILALWKSNNTRAFAGETVDEHIEIELEGTKAHFRNVIAPVTTNGNAVGILGINIDITEEVRTREKLKASLDTLQRTLEGTVAAMASIVELRDPYTSGHQRRVSSLVREIARELGLTSDQTTAVGLAAAVHDVGKIAIPTQILSKPGPITEIEMALIRTHTTAGHEILKTIQAPWPIADIVLQHHERQDGSGYPAALIGDEILPEARILAVADAAEALASHRPYRPARGIDVAIAALQEGSGSLYDSDAVSACVKVLQRRPELLESDRTAPPDQEYFRTEPMR